MLNETIFKKITALSDLLQNRFATAGDDGGVQLWDFDARAMLKRAPLAHAARSARASRTRRLRPSI